MLALFAQETEGETQLRGRNYKNTERELYHEREKSRNAQGKLQAKSKRSSATTLRATARR